MRLATKVAVVTGAGSGIGRAIALLFAQEGATVAAADLDSRGGQETAELIARAGGQGRFHHLDVTSAKDVQELMDATASDLGGLHILVNNAGIGVAANVIDTSEADWERIMAVNLKGVFLGMKYALPHMLHQGGGAIVNMASVAGLVGVLDRAAYCASKGGVIALTRAVAMDHVRQNIRVNCICPGTVDTPWVGRIIAGYSDPETTRQTMVERQPMGRLGTPEEIARAALYLASDDASFCTGTVLVVDGGMTAR